MLIAVIIVVIILLLILSGYNSLIRKKNAVNNAFASIDVMLKRRYDLIPQLVETVKGYMVHERETLEALTLLRTKALSTSTDTDTKVQLDNAISTGLKQIAVSVENYPDLKASQNFLKLQGALNETEEQLAASRRFYNAAITDYHNAIEVFPTSILASMMGLQHKTWFEITDEQRQVPATNFN